MSIDLTNKILSKEISNLSQSEKHILMVLCYRANKFNEVYSTIERLAKDCSCSIKTIERNLKSLRDKQYLIYTGKIAPKSKNIPIYRINFNHGQNDHDKSLTTDNLSFNHGQIGNLTTDKMGIRIDNNIKDNRKDIFKNSNGPKAFKEIYEKLK